MRIRRLEISSSIFDQLHELVTIQITMGLKSLAVIEDNF